MARASSRASQVARQSARFAAEAKAFGLRVREMRLARKWTLEQAAEASDVDLKHWQKIEAGRINVTLVTLVRLAGGFGEPLSSLFRRRSARKKG